jgi:hypothetical protein
MSCRAVPGHLGHVPSRKVDVATVADFAIGRLGVDPTDGLSVLDWLSLTGQSVLEVTAGPVFTDRTATLAPLRATLRWYPPDVERYVLAAGWQRLSQQMQMVGRTAERGDELGSRLLSTRLTEDLMWLAFALSQQWPPYAKWRGTGVVEQLHHDGQVLIGPLPQYETVPGQPELCGKRVHGYLVGGAAKQSCPMSGDGACPRPTDGIDGFVRGLRNTVGRCRLRSGEPSFQASLNRRRRPQRLWLLTYNVWSLCTRTHICVDPYRLSYDPTEDHPKTTE